MKWLTIAQIKRRSKTAKSALKVSYEHWCQLYDATAKELRAKFKRTDKNLIHGEYCGLCKYKNAISSRCFRCCVFEKFCEGDLWSNANATLNAWYSGNGSWHKWK